MKARTLTIAIGAVVALVGVTVQPAGAKVASKCTVPQKKVLVVGNGTKAPYYVGNPRGLESTAAKSCGKAIAKKVVPTIVHRPIVRPIVVTPLPAPVIQTATTVTPPPSAEACLDALASQDDSYVYIGVAGCDVPAAAPADAIDTDAAQG